LINVWATWCVPCAKEMPELEKMRARLAARGVDLIGLNVDTEAGANIRSYVLKKRVAYPILVGGVAAIEQIYATDELSVPLTILVNDQGIVTDLIPGWSAETKRKFDALVGIEQFAPNVSGNPTGKSN
jgi:thiol-disulfide isomerase/thioredoxin